MKAIYRVLVAIFFFMMGCYAELTGESAALPFIMSFLYFALSAATIDDPKPHKYLKKRENPKLVVDDKTQLVYSPYTGDYVNESLEMLFDTYTEVRFYAATRDMTVEKLYHHFGAVEEYAMDIYAEQFAKEISKRLEGDVIKYGWHVENEEKNEE